MRTIHCPRCSKQLTFAGETTVKAGSKNLNTEIYTCPKCGKMEFFTNAEPEMEKVVCAACGKSYDADFPRCPGCGKTNPRLAK